MLESLEIEPKLCILAINMTADTRETMEECVAESSLPA